MSTQGKTILLTMGGGKAGDTPRETDDYYATQPDALEKLLELEQFAPRIWECACGGGHLSRVLEAAGYDVTSTDLVYRGYGRGGVDFFDQTAVFDGDIITNPPYKYAQPFVEHALALVPDGAKVAMLLRLQFMESVSRRALFDAHPPKTVYVASKRIDCALNGDFEKYKAGAQAYAWFVWEKGYSGPTILKWFN